MAEPWIYECDECGARAEGGDGKRERVVCPFCPTVMRPVSPADLVAAFKRELERDDDD